MYRRLATLCTIGLVLAGCSSGTASTSEPSSSAASERSVATAEAPAGGTEPAADTGVADTAAVDAVLDHFIAFTVTLTKMDATSVDDALAEFRHARDELVAVGGALEAGIPGVPAPTTEAVASAVSTAQESLEAMTTCYEQSVASDCEAQAATAGEDAKALGTAAAGLVPYGTRTTEEFLAQLEGTSGAEAPDSDAAPASTQATDTLSESVAQANARQKALDYLDYSSFSRKGLIDQLEYEGFTSAQAVYGVDSVGL